MKRATKERHWRFRGICADASVLGVHRTSLYKVLTGERPGKNLMARYTDLKKDKANP